MKKVLLLSLIGASFTGQIFATDPWNFPWQSDEPYFDDSDEYNKLNGYGQFGSFFPEQNFDAPNSENNENSINTLPQPQNDQNGIPQAPNLVVTNSGNQQNTFVNSVENMLKILNALNKFNKFNCRIAAKTFSREDAEKANDFWRKTFSRYCVRDGNQWIVNPDSCPTNRRFKNNLIEVQELWNQRPAGGQDVETSGVSQPEQNSEPGVSLIDFEENLKKVKRKKMGWAVEEDQQLIQAVKENGTDDWKRIASCVPGKTNKQCRRRWMYVLTPEIKKGSFTEKEDDLFIAHVKEYGPNKWGLLAKQMTGRTVQQCCMRWKNYLDPSLKKEAWTQEEDELLFKLQRTYGNCWRKIAALMTGRSGNAIRNRWCSSVSKRICRGLDGKYHVLLALGSGHYLKNINLPQ